MLLKPSSLHKFFFTYICPRFYGGGSPAAPSQTTQTVNQNNIPSELLPYVTNMLNRAEPLTQEAYKPYSTNAEDYVAPFSPLQKTAQTGAANLQTPGQFAPASQMAGLSGLGSMTAGQNYQNQATNPNSVGAYMSPYIQNVMQQQGQAINRDYDITGTQQQGQATQAGAFGGSREALMAAENERNRNTTLNKMQAEGLQNAYTAANTNQQFGATLGLQGMGQGVQAAGQLGQLGTQQLAAQTGVMDTQNTIGGQQQAQQQQAINQSVLNYQNAQQYPYMQLGFMSDLLRGTPTGNSTQTQYQAQPSALSQIGGLAATGIGAYGALKANGGVIEDKGYANGGSVEGSMRGKLQDLDAPHLQSIIRENESPEMTALAKEVLATKYAKGGIVAFAAGGTPSASWLSQLENVSQEMKAKEYKLHGWTDEDIANYQSSKRVPLDPNKGLAQIPGESATINPKKEPLRSSRFTPEETAPYESSIEAGKELSTKVKSPWDPWVEQSNTNVKGQLKKSIGAIKSGIAPLATLENIAAFGSEVNAQRFKEGLGSESTISSIEQGVLGGASLAPELVKHLIEKGTGGTIGEQFRKARPGLANALDEFGDSASKRYEIIKNWATTPVGGNKGISAVEPTNPVEPKKIEPIVTEASVAPQKSTTTPSSASTADLPGSVAQVGVNPITAYQNQQADRHQAMQQVADAGKGRPANTTSTMGQGAPSQTTAPVQPEDSVLADMRRASDLAEKEAAIPMEERIQRQKDLEEKFVGGDTETAKYRKSLMDERANAPDEAKRQMYLRLMEFGANWGSTPGAPLAAGLKAITSTLPGLMEDTKANKKMMRELNKAEYDLNHAARLEQLGHIDKATAQKEKANDTVMKYKDKIVDGALKKMQLDQQKEISEAELANRITTTGMTNAASIQSHQITAGGTRKDNSQMTASTAGILRQKAMVDAKGMTEQYYTQDMKDGKGNKITEKQYLDNAYNELSARYLTGATPAELEQEKFMARRRGEQK